MSFSRLGLANQVNNPSFLTSSCETRKCLQLNAGHIVEPYRTNLAPLCIHITMHLVNNMLKDALSPTFHKTFASSVYETDLP